MLGEHHDPKDKRRNEQVSRKAAGGSIGEYSLGKKNKTESVLLEVLKEKGVGNDSADYRK
tara:strand:+ start:551 stop:730 length:180 start_codon:yes stop_codon:yes gene_type:complete